LEQQKKYHSLSDLAALADSTNMEHIHEPQPSNPASQNRKHDGKGKTVHLALDTHGRKGKAVTMVIGLRHNPATMEEIARILKQFCGTGGTVKEGKIELQGDQRTRAAEKMKEMNYLVK
jgi:predicted translation initiation factor SUI1